MHEYRQSRVDRTKLIVWQRLMVDDDELIWRLGMPNCYRKINEAHMFGKRRALAVDRDRRGSMNDYPRAVERSKVADHGAVGDEHSVRHRNPSIEVARKSTPRRACIAAGKTGYRDKARAVRIKRAV